jgi:arylformamidase
VSDQTLQQQYSIRAQIPEFEKIISRWADDSAVARRECHALVDLSYGTSAAEKLDVFPTTGTPKACILFLRGGFWRSLDKSTFSSIAPAYTQMGATVAVANYAHCPAVTLEDLIFQVYSVGSWLYTNADKLNLPRDRFHILAHSAGAHLGAMALARDYSSLGTAIPKTLFQSAVLVSGIYDLRPLVDLPFINNDIKLTSASAASVSPALIRLSADVKVTIASGELESDAFKSQSRELANQWRNNVAAEISLPATDHLGTFDTLRTPGTALHAAALKSFGL